ncbi:MAG: MoaD/ThiS family protein [Rhodospirillaceae bacterium]|nr:MoaD/ThiS family protein [Rhodospirillaceae bacterium]
MKLTVKLFASLTTYLPTQAENQTTTLEAEDGSSVGQVLEMCGVPLDQCRLVMINGITHTNPAVSMELELREGDTLAVLPKVH